MIGYIYLITNNINNKQYIGQHRTNHINDGYMGSGVALHRAYKKYGLENFTKEILFYTVSKSVDNLLCILNALEKFYIRKYNTFKDGYNMTEGGDGKIGCIPWNKGLHGKQTPWNKGIQLNYSSFKGKHHSDSARQKMSEAKKGKPTWDKGLKLPKYKWITEDGSIKEMDKVNVKRWHPNWILLE